MPEGDTVHGIAHRIREQIGGKGIEVPPRLRAVAPDPVKVVFRQVMRLLPASEVSWGFIADRGAADDGVYY